MFVSKKKYKELEDKVDKLNRELDDLKAGLIYCDIMEKNLYADYSCYKYQPPINGAGNKLDRLMQYLSLEFSTEEAIPEKFTVVKKTTKKGK